jgi:hypothetical protein
MLQIKAIGTSLPDGSQLSTLDFRMDETLHHETGDGTQPVRHQLHWISSLHASPSEYQRIIMREEDARRHHEISLEYVLQKMIAARTAHRPPASGEM